MAALVAAFSLFDVAAAPAWNPAAAATATTIPLPCMSTEEFEAFKERHAEGLVAFGVTAAGALIQRIESLEGRWTLVLVVGDGLYCALATGEGWHALDRPVSGPRT